MKLGFAQMCLLLHLTFLTGSNSLTTSDSGITNENAHQLYHQCTKNLVKKAFRNSRKFYNRLSRNNTDYLKKLAKVESKIQKKLCLKNDKLADYLFKFSLSDRLEMRKGINSKPSYNAQLDTLKILLSFIKQKNLDNDTIKWNRANDFTIKAEKELSRYENNKKYLRIRKSELKAACSKYPELEQEMKGLDKANYYYTAQTEEYKNLLKEDGLINCNDYQELLTDKDFANFAGKESQIAKTFGVPAKVNTSVLTLPSSISSSVPNGLQTIKDVQAAMTESLKDMGSDAITKFESNMDVMHDQMDKLKDFSTIGGYNISNAADLPDFTPDPLKTKLFKDRFTKGFNLQFLQGNHSIPCGLSVSAEAGYKIKLRWIAGIALSTDCRIKNSSPDFDKLHTAIFAEYALTRTLWIYNDYSKEINVFSSRNENTNYKASLSRSKDYQLISGIKFKPGYSKKFSYCFLLGYDWTNEVDIEKGIIYRVGFNF